MHPYVIQSLVFEMHITIKWHKVSNDETIGASG
jgi:hypothetical protein